MKVHNLFCSAKARYAITRDWRAIKQKTPCWKGYVCVIIILLCGMSILLFSSPLMDTYITGIKIIVRPVSKILMQSKS